MAQLKLWVIKAYCNQCMRHIEVTVPGNPMNIPPFVSRVDHLSEQSHNIDVETP